MELGITIPLERFLKMEKPPYGQETDNLFCWELHVILLQGRPSLIGVNCGTRFAFVLADLSREDREQLPRIAMEEIESSLREAGISEDRIRAYLRQAKAPNITKTHGRSQVAYLNKAVDLLMWNDIACNSRGKRQPVLNDILNRTPTKCTGQSESEPPVERLLEKLENLGR